MHYSLLLHFPERPREDLTPEEMRNGMNYFDRFAKELDHAGVLVSAELLERSPETVTVRLVGETIEEIDGPEEEEHAPLGGIIVIDVDNQEQAIRYAHRAPSMAWGPVEVRAAMARFVDGEWISVEEIEVEVVDVEVEGEAVAGAAEVDVEVERPISPAG